MTFGAGAAFRKAGQGTYEANALINIHHRLPDEPGTPANDTALDFDRSNFAQSDALDLAREMSFFNITSPKSVKRFQNAKTELIIRLKELEGLSQQVQKRGIASNEDLAVLKAKIGEMEGGLKLLASDAPHIWQQLVAPIEKQDHVLHGLLEDLSTPGSQLDNIWAGHIDPILDAKAGQGVASNTSSQTYPEGAQGRWQLMADKLRRGVSSNAKNVQADFATMLQGTQAGKSVQDALVHYDRSALLRLNTILRGRDTTPLANMADALRQVDTGTRQALKAELLKRYPLDLTQAEHKPARQVIDTIFDTPASGYIEYSASHKSGMILGDDFDHLRKQLAKAEDGMKDASDMDVLLNDSFFDSGLKLLSERLNEKGAESAVSAQALKEEIDLTLQMQDGEKALLALANRLEDPAKTQFTEMIDRTKAAPQNQAAGGGSRKQAVGKTAVTLGALTLGAVGIANVGSPDDRPTLEDLTSAEEIAATEATVAAETETTIAEPTTATPEQMALSITPEEYLALLQEQGLLTEQTPFGGATFQQEFTNAPIG
ncbi:MAG: hypothetical protein KTR14_09530, partial [Vampirovibrio sp.]|nr:hypothetical protein [Vampirovibrio sp.]